MVESIIQISDEKNSVESIYRNLLATVRVCIHEKIDKLRIEQSIDTIISVFERDQYHPLLLSIYQQFEGNYIYSHIAHNVILSIAFGKSLSLSKVELKEVGLCAFGHDFGMVSFIELAQKTTQLSSEENQTIHHHPIKSAEIFGSYFSEKVINGILEMHECVNGKGYPKGKSGNEISFLAKMISICDVYEALTHARNFRGAYSPFEAMKMIIKKKDQMFDKRVIKKFVEFLSIYPIGNLVYLNTGELGMVVASNPGYPTRSVIKILSNSNKEIEQSPKTVDLLNDSMLYVAGVVDLNKEQELVQSLRSRGGFYV